MQKLINIEFFSAPEGEVMIRDIEGVSTYKPEDKELTASLFAVIEADYPKAFKALSEMYHKSRANVNYFRFLVCRRFIRCNFGLLDRTLDIDGAGRFHFEEIDCPMAGECKNYKVVCSPEFNNKLSARQTEVMKLYMEGMGESEIGEMLSISPATVVTTKRDAMRKTECHSLAEFTIKFKDKI